VKRDAAAEVFIRKLDSRAMPRYSFGEAGGYLGLPESTIRSWFVGMPYGSGPNVKRMERILVPASKDLLSFYDIASAHVLMAFKAKGARPIDLRNIVRELEKEFPGARYPLLGRDFQFFRNDVVVRIAGKLLNLSKSRQLGPAQTRPRHCRGCRRRADCDGRRSRRRGAGQRNRRTAVGTGWHMCCIRRDSMSERS
jgi:hypothetical protein